MRVRDLVRRFRVATVLTLAVICPLRAFASSWAAPTRHGLHPSIFNLQPNAIRGWQADAILVSRRENNWHAWSDSHEAGRYFYHGPWTTAGRESGWCERLTLSRGAITAQVVDIVSLFANAASAQAAYQVMIRQAPNAAPLPHLGLTAIAFSPSGGVASGRNLVVWSRSFDVYVQADSMVAEVSAEESEQTRPGFQMPTLNAARAVALALIRVERHPEPAGGKLTARHGEV